MTPVTTPHTASYTKPAGLKFRVVAGAAAGNVTVTGIKTTDELIYVGGFSVAAALDTLLNQVRNYLLYQPLGNPTFAIDTNFDVKNTEPISYVNGGTIKTLADNTSWNTGTAKVITANKWNAALLTVNASGNAILTWAAAAGYDSEALAIAALALPDSTSTVLGMVTVLTGTDVTWTAGTDALQGGTGGTPATTTTYYNQVNTNALMLGAAASSTPVTPLNNLTSEFTITAANTINNAAGTASTDGVLLVVWNTRSAIFDP